MKKKMFFISLIIVATIGFLSLGLGTKDSKASFLFNSIETLATLELEVTVTCPSSPHGGGKCQLIEQYRCLNGTTAARCYYTGTPANNCSSLMVILCSLVGQL